MMHQASDELAIDSMEALNESFTYNWNDPKTIEPIKLKIPMIERVLAGSLPASLRTREALIARARMRVKLGCYYAHVDPQLERASCYLTDALITLVSGQVGQDEIAWLRNHLAYVCLQNLILYRKTQKGIIGDWNYVHAEMHYSQVINDYKNNDTPEGIEIKSYAYFLKALTEYELGEQGEAVVSYRTYMDLCQANNLPDGHLENTKKHLVVNAYAESFMLLFPRKFSAESNQAIFDKPYSGANPS